MRFLIDESVEYRVVEFLRSEGHDVITVAENAPGLRDTDVLSFAYKTKRILLTNDKDFGTLVFVGRHLHAGVILIRLSKEDAVSKIDKLQAVLSRYSKSLHGAFVVITNEKVRIRSSAN